MGRLEGKVAFITGAGRGQGRAHAVRLAEEGAAIIAVDVCHDIDGIAMPLATSEDLAQTVREVEDVDGRILAREADVRDSGALEAAVAEGIAQFGPIDIVVANAGVAAYKDFPSLTEDVWRTTMAVNLTGVYRTVKAALPSMVEAGNGGSIILISSGSTFRGGGLLTDYASSKSGVVGIMRSLALELGPYGIRVNSIMPSTVLTKIVDNEVFAEVVSNAMNGGHPFESREQRLQAMDAMIAPRHMIPQGWVDPRDISEGVLFLASDDSRYITSESLRIDLGFAGK
jgi:SDR family mycofactocin-dependent oxidoreductase